jgi:hypothetical protein
MKKQILLILFLLLFVSPAISQVYQKPFEEFTGTWEGVYEVGGFRNKEVIENRLIHKDRFFEMYVWGHLEGNPGNKYSNSAVFTVNDKNEIIGWGFDETGYKGIVNYKGELSDNKVIFMGECLNYNIEVSFDIRDNLLIRRSKWIFKDSPDKPSIVECIYKRI